MRSRGAAVRVPGARRRRSRSRSKNCSLGARVGRVGCTRRDFEMRGDVRKQKTQAAPRGAPCLAKSTAALHTQREAQWRSRNDLGLSVSRLKITVKGKDHSVGIVGSGRRDAKGAPFIGRAQHSLVQLQRAPAGPQLVSAPSVCGYLCARSVRTVQQ
eukprot:2024912-Pleurochrysis_carterae.AAC.3